MKIETVLQR